MALFNWLYARHEGGTFIVRIEDTDPEAARPEFIEPILDALRWLGLDWDEGLHAGGAHGPYRQSERRDVHLEALRKLEEAGAVYRCTCTREDIAARGTKMGYDRHCRTHPPTDGKPYALRFKVPEGRDVVVHDLIRGEVRTPFEELQDFVVARSDGTPTFLLANAADDIAMEITHAIRGNDLLAAAGQTTLLFEALGSEPPAYAHLPLILAPDRSKLSSRHGATGVHAFQEAGYLPEAMVNFLALLGWSSPSHDEILSRDRIVEEFTLDRVSPANPIFDRQKLDWMNAEYIKALPPDDLEARILGLYPDLPKDTLRKTIDLELIQTRITTLSEVQDAIRYLHTRPDIDPKAAAKWLGTEEANRTLTEVADVLESLEPWEAEAIMAAIQAKIAELGLHRRKGPKPIFVAISGSEVALPIFQSIWILGRAESVVRLRAAAR
jgi:glutamyl-tRNA synthetase